jgi:hypothetical protein
MYQSTVHSLQPTALEFTHLVVASDGTTFACAKDEHGKLQNYLVSRNGDVKQQVNSHFELLNDADAEYIRCKLEACYAAVTIYKIRSIELS